MLTETEIRKVIARALNVLGHGPLRPCDVPSKTVVALQLALENGQISLPLTGGVDSKVQTALISGVLGLMALSNASNDSERWSAAAQIRKCAAEAATA
jgi:hypothetical protein